MNTILVGLYVLLLTALSAHGRPGKIYKLYVNPLERALEQDITSTAQELEVPQLSTHTNFFATKPRNFEADEGRFLSHLFFFRNFMQVPTNNNSGFMMPLLVINNPANLSSVNTNTLTNVTPAPVVAARAGLDPNTFLTDSAGTSITLPYDLPLPLNAQFYQQHQLEDGPQLFYGVPINGENQGQRKRNRLQKRKNTNPFEKLAKSRTRVQFLK